MDILHMVLLLLAGCCAGFLAGFFGVGGGLILVPILLLYFQAIHVTSLVSTHMAFGTSLLIVMFASMSSAIPVSEERTRLLEGRSCTSVSRAWWADFSVQLIAGGLEGKSLRQIFARRGDRVGIAAARGDTQTEDRRDAGCADTAVARHRVLCRIGVGTRRCRRWRSDDTGHAFDAQIPPEEGAWHIERNHRDHCIRGRTRVCGPRDGRTRSYRPGTLGYVDWLTALPLIVGSIPLAAVGATCREQDEGHALEADLCAVPPRDRTADAVLLTNVSRFVSPLCNNRRARSRKRDDRALSHPTVLDHRPSFVSIIASTAFRSSGLFTKSRPSDSTTSSFPLVYRAIHDS